MVIADIRQSKTGASREGGETRPRLSGLREALLLKHLPTVPTSTVNERACACTLHSLLKLFVDVVDAELLEVVAVEDLETVNV